MQVAVPAELTVRLVKTAATVNTVTVVARVRFVSRRNTIKREEGNCPDPIILNRLKTYLMRINVIAFLLSITCSTVVMAQTTHPKQQAKRPVKKGNKCTTWVGNLSTDDIHSKDICFSVTMVGHADMHELHDWEPRKKTDEVWRYAIDIEDNQGNTSKRSEAAYYLYEETSEVKQYHCSVDGVDCKALVFDKSHNSWEIILIQNDQWKILSSYPGFHFINAFGIKSREKASSEY